MLVSLTVLFALSATMRNAPGYARRSREIGPADAASGERCAVLELLQRGKICDGNETVVGVKMSLGHSQSRQCCTESLDLVRRHNVDFSSHRHDGLPHALCLPGRHGLVDRLLGRTAVDLLPAPARRRVGPAPIALRIKRVAFPEKFGPRDVWFHVLRGV